MNEPAVYALGGYAAGVTPPGVQDLKRSMQVMIHLMQAHGLAYHAIKAKQPRSLVSFAHHLRSFKPGNILNPLDHLGSYISSQVFNWSWFETIQSGRVEMWIPGIFKFYESAPESLGALDYLGFNYYSRDVHRNAIHLKTTQDTDVRPTAGRARTKGHANARSTSKLPVSEQSHLEPDEERVKKSRNRAKTRDFCNSEKYRRPVSIP
jgi:beta-glucosidase